MPVIGETIIQLAVSAFFAILFLQSGFDKVFDWKGNLEFHTGHFANSPLSRFSKPMLVAVTLMEIACGSLCFIGLIQLLINGQRFISFYGVALALALFLCLFFGQRISKDYKGAATLVPYFILSIIGIIFLA